MKFLSTLWTIQTWARSQSSLRLYSSSLLLVYDARVLKNQFLFSRSSDNSLAASPNGSLSPVLNNSSNSGKLVTNTCLNWPTQSYGHANGNGVNGISGQTSDGGDANKGSRIGTGETIQLYKQLQRSHSTHNNYDEVCHSHSCICTIAKRGLKWLVQNISARSIRKGKDVDKHLICSIKLIPMKSLILWLHWSLSAQRF